MLPVIPEEIKQDFVEAAKKIGLPSTELPDYSMLRPDFALWLTAKYMLAVLLEADNDGVVNDITNHDVRKYEPWFVADHGYQPGSDTSGFRLGGALCARTGSYVGARLSSTTREKCESNSGKYRILWEICMLNVR